MLLPDNMTKIAETELGDLVFCPSPSDDPVMVHVVNDEQTTITPPLNLGEIDNDWDIVVFDAPCWEAVKAALVLAGQGEP